MATLEKSDSMHSQQSSQPERKQVTVLFCDVADYTSRSVSMDPEDLADDIRVFQTLCGKIAEKYQGHIANFLGDGILVLFGYPQANEFSSEHAVRAGLEMVKAIKQNNLSSQWQSRDPISIRVGIATSLVVVGERAGQQRDQDELIFGEAPNLAARLQSIAKPNTVCVSSRTRRLIGGTFEFRDLGEHDLKGFSDPISVWQVLDESTFQNRTNTTLKRVTSRFVSRGEELAFLSSHFQRAKLGETQIIHLSGEPGIGKSRLLRVFEKTLNKQNLYRIRISCSPYFISSALKPIVDETYRWLQISRDDDVKIKQHSIRWAMSVLNIKNDQDIALFSELLSVDLPPDIKPLDISAEEKHRRIIDMLREVVFLLSSRFPIFLVVEDLQWADPSTLELLDAVVKNAGEHRVFAVFTSRPEFVPNWKSPHFFQIKLKGLDETASENMVKAVFGETHLPETVKHALIKKSDGVPLFLEESCWHILTRIKNSTNYLDSAEMETEIPETLQDSLNARLDELGSVKALAQLASAFGNDFSYSAIDNIASQNNIDTRNGIDILLDANFLRVIPGKGEDHYAFRHAMFQEAAYQSLLRKTRQRYHQQIADLLLDQDPDITDNRPELIAYHYGRSDQLDTALDLWLKAGKIAIAQSAISEAMEHLNEGLTLIQHLPSTDDRKRSELSLQLNLAVCLTVRSGYFGKQVTQTYERSRQLAYEVGTLEQQWTSLYGLWRCFLCQAEYASSLKISAKMKVLCEKVNDPKLFLTVYGIQGMTRMVAGKFAAAENYYDKSVSLYDYGTDKSIGLSFGQDPYVTIKGLGAVNRLICAKIEQSQQESDTSVETARQIGHPYTVAETLRVAAMYQHISGNMERLQELAEETIELSELYGFEGFKAAGNIFLANSRVALNNDVSAIDMIKENLIAYEEKFGLLFLPYFQGLLAESYFHIGKYRKAYDKTDDVLDMAKRYGEDWVISPMLRIKALAAEAGELAPSWKIDQWFQQALDVAIEQKANLFIQRAQKVLKAEDREKLPLRKRSADIYQLKNFSSSS